jgi:hypothetical protein
MTMTPAHMRVLSGLMLLAAMMLHSCGGGVGNDSITDCSRKGRPQHYDGQRWRC